MINCEKCQNSYCSTNLLDMHYFEVHNKKIYTCSLCTKSLNSQLKLKCHIDSIHKGIKQIAPKRMRKCASCNWKGENLRIHWNEKVWKKITSYPKEYYTANIYISSCKDYKWML